MLSISFKNVAKNFQITITRSLSTNWYYAIDVPIKESIQAKQLSEDQPREFKQFTKHDTTKLTEAYKKYVSSSKKSNQVVNVSEDNLFCVHFDKMELKPIYWDGPSYEVRRGIWFDSSDIPIPETLSSEIDKLSNKFKKDDPDTCIYKLETNKYKGIQYVLFISDVEAFLLPDLSGGSIHIKFLKSGIGQYLPINGKKITKYTNQKKIQQLSDHNTNTDQRSENRSIPSIDQQKNSSTATSPWLDWDFYNQLPNFWVGDWSQINFSNTNESKVVQSAYDDQDKSSKNAHYRKIRHLVLCVHGIGQTLGKKYEHINFAHTVNLLRTNMKQLYDASFDLKSLNKIRGNMDWETNCGVQVLPITWRHSIGFDTEPSEEIKVKSNFPTLSDITINGILPLRKLVGDVAIDVVLYEEPYYREIILKEVCKQLNKTYNLFKRMNKDPPEEIHLIGHSLGSVILFDILKDPQKYPLDFDVKKFFCIGSPVGLLKLVQRTKISPFGSTSSSDININQPKCEDLYNIYHTCDPIAYRMEPLIHPSLSTIENYILPHFSELDGITSKFLQVGGEILEKLPSTETKPIQVENGNNTAIESNNKNQIPDDARKLLFQLNHLGRVDYAMASDMLEVNAIAAIRSHVSYFKDPDIAGFILKEILATKKKYWDIKN